MIPTWAIQSCMLRGGRWSLETIRICFMLPLVSFAVLPLWLTGQTLAWGWQSYQLTMHTKEKGQSAIRRDVRLGVNHVGHASGSLGNPASNLVAEPIKDDHGCCRTCKQFRFLVCRSALIWLRHCFWVEASHCWIPCFWFFLTALIPSITLSPITDRRKQHWPQPEVLNGQVGLVRLSQWNFLVWHRVSLTWLCWVQMQQFCRRKMLWLISNVFTCQGKPWSWSDLRMGDMCRWMMNQDVWIGSGTSRQDKPEFMIWSIMQTEFWHRKHWRQHCSINLRLRMLCRKWHIGDWVPKVWTLLFFWQRCFWYLRWFWHRKYWRQHCSINLRLRMLCRKWHIGDWVPKVWTLLFFWQRCFWYLRWFVACSRILSDHIINNMVDQEVQALVSQTLDRLLWELQHWSVLHLGRSNAITSTLFAAG